MLNVGYVGVPKYTPFCGKNGGCKIFIFYSYFANKFYEKYFCIYPIFVLDRMGKNTFFPVSRDYNLILKSAMRLYSDVE